MPTELQETKRELEKLRRREMELEAESFQGKILPQIQESIGKTFVYRGNSYGRDGKWDSFRKVRDFSFSDLHAWIIYEECRIDSDGKPSLGVMAELASRRSSSEREPFSLDQGWKACDPKEYERARAATLQQLEKPELFKKYLAR